MFSKRELEGYLLIDHRESPGITQAEAAQAGRGTIPVGKGMRFESATTSCSNCRRLIVINPLRTRERFYCQKCDSYHCDECAGLTKITGVCKTMKQRLDEFIDNGARLIA